MSFVGPAVGSFIGGTVSTYLFHRPSLNKEGFKVLVSGGLQGTALIVASLMISYAASKYVPRIISSDQQEKKWAANTFMGTFLACVIAVPVAAKTLTHRLGTPTEAFVNFAISLVFLGISA